MVEPAHPRPWHPGLHIKNWAGQRDKHMAHKYPEVWPTLEQHLRHGWHPADARALAGKLFPGKPLPSARLLKRAISAKPASWYVVHILAVPPASTNRGR